MRLTELLNDSDISDLRNIAKYYECDCNPHSKNELIQGILYLLDHHVEAQFYINRLAPSHWQFLQLLLLDERLTYSLEEMESKARAACQLVDAPQTPRQIIQDAITYGWVFKQLKKGMVQFRIAADWKEARLKDCLAIWQKNIKIRHEPLVYHDEDTLLLQDLKLFLKYIERKDAITTSNGVLYKRIQQELLKSFHVGEDPVDGRGWRFGYGRRFPDYPDRFALIYDFCYYHQFIREEEFLKLTPLANMVWEANEDEMMFKLFAFWQKLYKKSIPNLPIAIRFILEVARHDWVDGQDVIHTLKQWVKPFYYEDSETVVSKRIINMLHHLGYLQRGYTVDSSFSLHASKRFVQSINWFERTKGKK
jgi:hypothetical protein